MNSLALSNHGYFVNFRRIWISAMKFFSNKVAEWNFCFDDLLV